MVVRILEALEQSRRYCPVDQFDGAVVPQEEMLGDVADRWKSSVAFHREEQLVLCASEPHRSCLAVAPVQESPKSITERE